LNCNKTNTLTLKDSGFPWLGKIPDNWQVKKLQYVARLKSGDSITAALIQEEGPFPVYGGNGLRGYYSDYTHDGEYILIGRQGVLCGNIHYARGKFWASEHAIVVSPATPYKVYWLGEVLRAINLNQYSVSAAQPGLFVESISKIKIPFPPLKEQGKIASFLDRKTAAIARLIEKKKCLIQLLEEKRTALINQAVTKGLNPDIPMKDSGIPWIGEIPAHWEVRQLKYVCVLQRGFDLPSQDRKEGGYPIYSGGGITGYHSKAMVKPPGIVTGRYGTVGEIYFVEEPFWPLNTSLYVREFWNSSPLFVKYLLSILNFKSYSAKSAVPRVDRNDLHVIPVAVPTRNEQDIIAIHLQRYSNNVQEISAKIRNQIFKLEEYRQSLITAAVTGKIDVAQEVAV
jgi:type I restriction enzyme S subunit